MNPYDDLWKNPEDSYREVSVATAISLIVIGMVLAVVLAGIVWGVGHLWNPPKTERVVGGCWNGQTYVTCQRTDESQK